MRTRCVVGAVLLGIMVAGAVGAPVFALSEGVSRPRSIPAAADPVVVSLRSMEQAAGSPIASTRSPLTGFVTFMEASVAPIALSLPATADARARAWAFLSTHGSAFGIADRANLAFIRSSAPDVVGMEQVRWRQMFRGLPITGAELSVHLRGTGVVAVNAKTLEVGDKFATTPGIEAAEALARAERFIVKEFGISDAVLSPPRLEVFNRGLLETRRAPTRLAWFIEARRIDLRQFIWIDAQDGRLLLEFSQLTDARQRGVHTANGRSTLPGTLVRSESRPATGDLDADAAYDFSGDAYDYYLTQHGRDSYDGVGAPIISTVHYCPSNDGCDYGNAFWNGVQMVYGNGFSQADDVDAHELTHAVTEHSAGLFYYMQSGALNESYSDIFGETVDLMNGRGNDTAGVRWLLGEDLLGIGAIRNLMNPNVFGEPGKMSDDALFVCATPGVDGGGVHSNSGVPNHAYALMVDGGSYNGRTIAGIGLIKAGKIQYRNLTTYLLSASDFLDNYHGIKRACTDLVGTSGITTHDCTEVGKALDAVEMARAWPCAPPQPTVPPFCPAGRTPRNYLFFDDLENPGAGNWAITRLSGSTTHWVYPPPADFVFAASGAQNFWGADVEVAGDSVIAMIRSVQIPAGGAVLRFNHAFGFEDPRYDGGVIEYSIDGGASWVDGGALITGGAAYGGPIAFGFGNPLAGRNAFIGDSFGYTTSQLDLARLGGRDARFRFRLGTDISVDDYGWFIDDIAIYQCRPPATNDYDGDGRSDIALYRPTGGFWYLINSASGSVGAQQWGAPDDIPVAGDYDGDGKADITVFRPSTGMWYILNSASGSSRAQQWGAPDDIPVAGDYDGDGQTDLAVYRPSTGVWYIFDLVTGSNRAQQWGAPGDIPVSGDYDGDGKADMTVFRPSTALWYILDSVTGSSRSLQWGAGEDLPISGWPGTLSEASLHTGERAGGQDVVEPSR
jgi:Zn-dependent metalloprotease